MVPTRRYAMLLLFVLLMCVVSLLASYRHHGHIVEPYMSNVAEIDTSLALGFFGLPGQKHNNNTGSGEKSNGRDPKQEEMFAKWTKCNILDCPDLDPNFDYEEYLRRQREQAALGTQAAKLKNNTPQAKPALKCPPQLTYDDFNMQFFTDEELDQEARLEDIESQVSDATNKMKELEDEYAKRKMELESELMSMQIGRYELEKSQAQQKDLKVFETAVDSYVKPWQNQIDKLGKNVEILSKDISKLSPSIRDSVKKDLDGIRTQLKDLDGIRKQLEEVKKSVAAQKNGSASSVIKSLNPFSKVKNPFKKKNKKNKKK